MNLLSGLLSNIRSFVQSALYILPVSLISLTFHEFAHGFVANKLGDPTAKDEGRLSLNPLRHLDPLGFLFMIIFRVGFAKPVPVNPLYFKNPKKGMLITAAAGPLSNFILAIVCSFFSVVFAYGTYLKGSMAVEILFTFFYLMTLINLGLAVFNLIPVHPFDGSRILGYFMPNSYHRFVMQYGNYIYIAFFVLLIATDYVSIAVSNVQEFLYRTLTVIWQHPAFFVADIIF